MPDKADAPVQLELPLFEDDENPTEEVATVEILESSPAESYCPQCETGFCGRHAGTR